MTIRGRSVTDLRVWPGAVRVPRISATLGRLAGLNQAAICW